MDKASKHISKNNEAKIVMNSYFNSVASRYRNSIDKAEHTLFPQFLENSQLTLMEEWRG